MAQTVKTRIRQKHETAENWSKATGFKPLDGELIVYNADDTQGPRLKVGDGATAAPDLPFAEAVPTGIFGTCETAADVAAKEVAIENFKLKVGSIVIIKFRYANSVASPTLNVNGTGDKPMYRVGASTKADGTEVAATAMSTSSSTSGWAAGAIQMFVYDGTGWVRDYWTNSTYTNVSLGQGYSTCSTAASTAAKTASLSSYTLSAGGVVTIKFTNAVPANATLNINSKGAKYIYFRDAKITAGIIKAGDTATFITKYASSTYSYHLIAIDRWQNDITALQDDVINHTHTVSHTPAGSVSQPTFTGTEAGHTHSFSVSGGGSHGHTFKGTAASHDHSFTGTAASHDHTFTGTGTVIKATFTGTAHTDSNEYTPAGSVSTPTITVTPNTTTVNSITAVGTLPSLTYTEGTASKITAWSAGTAPSITYSKTTPDDITAWSAGTLPSLTFTQGTLPSASLSGGSASLTGSVSTGPNRVVTLSHSHSNPTLSFSAGTLPTATFSAGTLPSLTYSAAESSKITAWSAGSVPSITYSEVNADDITAWSAGTLPTKGSNTTVVTGIKSAKSTQPTFTGTKATISHTCTPAGTIAITTAAPGTDETANYTPAGTISSKSLTPAGTVGSKSLTPAGTVEANTISISGTTGETKITPAGTVSKPTFTGTAATLTTSTATT